MSANGRHEERNVADAVLGNPDLRRHIFAIKYERSNRDIREAVPHWIWNPEYAEMEYGHISRWNVSKVTSMRQLFHPSIYLYSDVCRMLSEDLGDEEEFVQLYLRKARAFNEDLSGWDVSNVTDMSEMFRGVMSFNGDIKEWDTSSVTNMKGMFQGAQSFNRDINSWNTSKVKYMQGMFMDAISFDGNISQWDTRNVLRMDFMFQNAQSFSGDLSRWDTSSLKSNADMFQGAEKFRGVFGRRSGL